MEIITVVFDGEITHEDSLGNKTVIRAGDVQRMSAGTGITHSEFNLADEPVQFCQIWIYPEQSGLTPSYDQRHYDHTLWQDDLYAIASGQNIDEVVTFHADATIYRADLAPGVVLPYQAEPGRTTFLYLNSGELRINGQRLKSGDQLRAKTDEVLELHSISHSSFILIDLP
jgi:redox-sensitive bicupin YhaK (pirin superfamily)